MFAKSDLITKIYQDMKNFQILINLRNALNRFLRKHIVKRSYLSEQTTLTKPKGCESELYPHNCHKGGCLYCIRYNTFKASL